MRVYCVAEQLPPSSGEYDELIENLAISWSMSTFEPSTRSCCVVVDVGRDVERDDGAKSGRS